MSKKKNFSWAFIDNDQRLSVCKAQQCEKRGRDERAERHVFWEGEQELEVKGPMAPYLWYFIAVNACLRKEAGEGKGIRHIVREGPVTDGSPGFSRLCINFKLAIRWPIK